MSAEVDPRVVGFFFGAGVSFLNFFLLKRWAMRLGNFEKQGALFLTTLFVRYLLLFSGIFVIVNGKWCHRAFGLTGLLGTYVGLLAYEFIKLKKKGE